MLSALTWIAQLFERKVSITWLPFSARAKQLLLCKFWIAAHVLEGSVCFICLFTTSSTFPREICI